MLLSMDCARPLDRSPVRCERDMAGMRRRPWIGSWRRAFSKWETTAAGKIG